MLAGTTLPTGGVRGVVTGPEPAVIDEELCRKCILTVRTRPTQSGEVETKKEPTAFREVKALLLSYMNILKIDNLVGFDKLIKLQLDNNIIEKIENLSHLTNLEALDLSFNNITVIEGLESLTNLTTLSLFANRITTLGGLDTLDKLQVLSVGNNLIAQLDNVMYLRPFTRLQAVNLVGNPFCQEDEYRRYVLAHLKYIKYLDYRLVDQQAVGQAKEQYQDELLDLEENENQEEERVKAADEKAERAATHKSANMKGMDDLFDDIMIKGDGEMAKLRGQQQFAEAQAQLLDQVNAAAEEHIATVLSHRELKDKEEADFTAAIEHAKEEAAAESKAEIAKYNALAKRSLTDTTEQPHAVVQTLHKANDALYERLMDLEVSSSERYAESISAFESSYEEQTKRTFEVITQFFQRLRDLEATYHERLVGAGGELLEKVANDQAEYLPDEVRLMLQDKDTCQGFINSAHDARVARLDAKEDEWRTLEDQGCKAVVKKAVDSEYTRNRTRVIEIWNICQVVNKSELATDRFDD